MSFIETTNDSSSTAFTPCLGIRAVITLGLSGASPISVRFDDKLDSQKSKQNEFLAGMEV